DRAIRFDKTDYGLPSLPVEIWQGWIFTSFDQAASPLGPGLVELDPPLAGYQLDRAVTRAGKTLTGLPWTWKVMLENFNDPYHPSRLHGALQTFAPSGMSDFFEWREDMQHVSRIQHFTHMDGSFNPTQRCLLPVFPALTEQDRMRGMFALVPP